MAGAGETRRPPEHTSGGEAPRYSARLVMSCPDRPGIVAAVSGFLFARGANIVSSQQYSSDPSGGRLFLRTEFFLPPEAAGDGAADSFGAALAAGVADGFSIDWRLSWWGERP